MGWVLAEDPLAHSVCVKRLVDAFPHPSPCDAAWGTGVQQAGRSLQCKTACATSLRSGVNLCFTLLCWSLYFSGFRIAVWFSTSLQHSGSLWRVPSAISSRLPVPESTRHFLPQAGKHRYGAEIKPAKSCTMLPWKDLPRSIWDHTLEPSCFLPQV